MQTISQIITKIIDFFYRPFSKYIPQQLFRYAACGGGNMVLDWVLYFVVYNFVVGHELVYITLPNRLIASLLNSSYHVAVDCVSNHIADGFFAE